MADMPGLRRSQYPMTFEQIGAELGVSKQEAQQCFRRAIFKLRHQRPIALVHLYALGQELQRQREAREIVIPE